LHQKDRERNVYGLKEKNIAKTYITLMGLTKNDPDAIRLMNWKKPTEKDVSMTTHVYLRSFKRIWQKSSGDFPTVLYEVVSKRSSVIDETLSIQDVNDFLEELCETHNKRYDQPVFSVLHLSKIRLSTVQAKILQRLYNRATPEEQRWIVRIILKGVSSP
jgi:DNA ligase 4